MTFTYQYRMHVDDNKIGDQYNVLLCYFLAFILKRLRTLIRIFEVQITEKIRTSSLGEKKGVLIKKKCKTLIRTSQAQINEKKTSSLGEKQGRIHGTRFA